MVEFEAGRYSDHKGVRWFCAQRSDSKTIVCHSDDGFMTAADPQTFRAWNWQKEPRP